MSGNVLYINAMDEEKEVYLPDIQSVYYNAISNILTIEYREDEFLTIVWEVKQNRVRRFDIG